MDIKIKRVDNTLPLPEYHTDGAVAFDIYTRQDAHIAPRSFEKLPSNLIIQIPHGYALIIAPRSSSAPKKGLTMRNGIGIIDQDFCGEHDEISILVYNFTTEEKIIERGERIAQGLFVPIEQAVWQEVDTMEHNSRGGFGTTG